VARSVLTRLFAPLLGLAFALVPAVASADQVLSSPRLDNNGVLNFRGGLNIGTPQGGFFYPALPANYSGPTRAGIPATRFAASVSSIVASGYASVGDRGAGCVYVRGASTGPNAVQDAAGGWWNHAYGRPVDIGCFGAKVDGTTDDSGPVQAAVTAATAFGPGATVTIPNGLSRFCNINIPSNVTISGQGRNASLVKASTATCTPFVANFGATLTTGGGNILIEKLGFYGAGSSAQTSGAFVYFSNCTSCRVTEFEMSGAYIGVQVTGANTINVSVDHGRSNGASLFHFYVAGGADTFFDHIVTQAAGGVPQSNCGIAIAQTGGVWISDVDITASGNGTCLQPGDGQSVKWIFVSNSVLGDSGTGSGLVVSPSGSGIVQGVSITNSWTASNNGAGVSTSCNVTGAGTGSIDGLRIAMHRSLDNGADGFAFGCGRNIRLIAPTAQGNSNPAHGGTAGVFSGVSFAAGISNFSVVDGDFTQMAGEQVLQKYGILVGGNPSNYFTIRGNDGSGGTTSGVTVQNNSANGPQSITGNF
jgi:hypothetical protein